MTLHNSWLLQPSCPAAGLQSSCARMLGSLAFQDELNEKLPCSVLACFHAVVQETRHAIIRPLSNDKPLPVRARGRLARRMSEGLSGGQGFATAVRSVSSDWCGCLSRARSRRLQTRAVLRLCAAAGICVEVENWGRQTVDRHGVEEGSRRDVGKPASYRMTHRHRPGRAYPTKSDEKHGLELILTRLAI